MGLFLTPKSRKARGTWAVHRRGLGQRFCPVWCTQTTLRAWLGRNRQPPEPWTISLPRPGLLDTQARRPLCRMGIHWCWTLVCGCC